MWPSSSETFNDNTINYTAGITHLQAKYRLRYEQFKILDGMN